jgi:hypothetical protein
MPRDLTHVCVENPNLRYNDCARQNRFNIRVMQTTLRYRYMRDLFRRHIFRIAKSRCGSILYDLTGCGMC